MGRCSRVAGGMVVAFVAAACAGCGSPAKQQTSEPTWIVTTGKTVHLTLIAGYQGKRGDLNFNGYAAGKMTITVPLGARVDVSFRNPSLLANSAQIVAYAPTPPTHTVADAFKGANSPNMVTGIPRGETRRFSFIASRAGKYLLISPVPGHAAAGMWDYFVVSKSAQEASISFHR